MVLRVYVVLLLWGSLSVAAVSSVDRQKCTIHSRKSGEKRRCINKTAGVLARIGRVDGLGIALGIDS